MVNEFSNKVDTGDLSERGFHRSGKRVQHKIGGGIGKLDAG